MGMQQGQALPRALAILAGGFLLLLLGLSLVPEEQAPDPIAQRPTPSAAQGTAAPRPSSTLVPTWPPRMHTALPPLATAQPMELALGSETVASVDRVGVWLRVRVADEAVLAGHVIPVEVELSNTTTRTFDVGWSTVVLRELAERSEPTWWPLEPEDRGGYLPRALAPGQTLTKTLPLYVPAEPAPPGQAYALWVTAGFAPERYLHDAPMRPAWRLEAGPIPLEVQPSSPEPAVQATLAITDNRWAIQVVEPVPVPAPDGIGLGFDGVIVFEDASGNTYPQQLETWAGGDWSDLVFPPSSISPFTARALVYAPGYRAAILKEEVSFARPYNPDQSFASLGEAEQALGRPIPQPRTGLGDATLERVRAIPAGFSRHDSYKTTIQEYRFPNGQLLTFTHSFLSTDDPARDIYRQRFSDDPDLEIISLEGALGYGSYHAGRIHLTWRWDSGVYELDAPRAYWSMDALRSLAWSVS